MSDRLHPYLGKFVPQLVEVCLRRHMRTGARVLDPFAGSGTTLVECAAFGAHSAGADISAFNALLVRVKTARHDLAGLAARSPRRSTRLDRATPPGRPPTTSTTGSRPRRWPTCGATRP